MFRACVRSRCLCVRTGAGVREDDRLGRMEIGDGDGMGMGDGDEGGL